jgi:hypothetical protein
MPCRCGHGKGVQMTNTKRKCNGLAHAISHCTDIHKAFHCSSESYQFLETWQSSCSARASISSIHGTEGHSAQNASDVCTQISKGVKCSTMDISTVRYKSEAIIL